MDTVRPCWGCLLHEPDPPLRPHHATEHGLTAVRVASKGPQVGPWTGCQYNSALLGVPAKQRTHLGLRAAWARSARTARAFWFHRSPPEPHVLLGAQNTDLANAWLSCGVLPLRSFNNEVRCGGSQHETALLGLCEARSDPRHPRTPGRPRPRRSAICKVGWGLVMNWVETGQSKPILHPP